MKRSASLGDKLRPAPENVFNAYRSTPPSKVKVVIMGQDPYPGNEAHGLSFSSQLQSIPASLRVVFRELELSGYGKRTNPNLQDWADQGVLLLNSILTTTYRMPNAHKEWGWQQFTGATLKALELLDQPISFLSWGASARSIIEGVQSSPELTVKRTMLYACHPQAENYSGGKVKFTGCNHFKYTNEFLLAFNQSPIKWV
jgi:uracil-DNA glycosylase